MKLFDKALTELNEALWNMADIAVDTGDDNSGKGTGAEKSKKDPQSGKGNSDENEDGEESKGQQGQPGKKGNKKGIDSEGDEDGQNQSGKKGNKKGQGSTGDDGGEKGEGDSDGDKKSGNGEAGEEEGEQEGDESGNKKSRNSGKEKTEKEKVRDYIKKGIKNGMFADGEDKFFSSASRDMKKAFSAVYKKVKRDIGARKSNGKPGEGSGDLMDLIDNYVDSADVDVKAILKDKLAKFAALYATSRSQMYGAQVQSTVSRQTGGRDVGSRPKQFQIEQPESAIVLFGLDTSGSVWDQPGAIEAAAGLLNDVFNSFKTQLKTKGDVFKFMWDTVVHEASFSLWRDEKTFSAHGGGGTDPQAVFDWIDNQFAEVTINGKSMKFGEVPPKTSIDSASKVDFVWDPKSDLLKKLGPEFAKNYRTSFKVPIKPNFDLYNKMKGMSDKDIESHIDSVMRRKASYLPGLEKMGKVPFLILFTDGEMSKPDIGNLYKTYPGNVFWVITTKHGLANANPPNALYLDLDELMEKYGKKK
jgi:hypothetical protein